MDTEKRALILIHICVLLWGFTAILGALITINPIILVLWRVIMAGLILSVMVIMQGFRRISTWAWLQLCLIGVFVGIHWVAFYSAIKYANASIAVVTISTASFFTALINPVIMRTAIRWNEVFLGLLIVPAIALIVGHVDLNMQTGFWIGIFAAALVGVFSSLTKRLLTRAPEVPVVQASMIQMWVIAVFLLLAMPFILMLYPDVQCIPTLVTDWKYLFLLSTFCTVLPFTLSMYAMRSISAFTSNLILNLEPVYGVLLAIIILREDKELNIYFYFGVALLFAVVFGHAMYNRRIGQHV